MRDLLLYASGILGLAAAFLHGWLGETRVFARVRIEPDGSSDSSGTAALWLGPQSPFC